MEKTVNTQGQAMGRKGVQTREKLLDALTVLLESCPLSDLRVVTVAQEARMSSATFYVYFPVLEAAVLHLARRVVDEVAGRSRTTASKHWDSGTEEMIASDLAWILADEVGSAWPVMSAAVSLWVQGSPDFRDLFGELLAIPMELIPTADRDCEDVLLVSLRSLVVEVVMLRGALARPRNERIQQLAALVEQSADFGTRKAVR